MCVDTLWERHERMHTRLGHTWLQGYGVWEAGWEGLLPVWFVITSMGNFCIKKFNKVKENKQSRGFLVEQQYFISCKTLHFTVEMNHSPSPQSLHQEHGWICPFLGKKKEWISKEHWLFRDTPRSQLSNTKVLDLGKLSSLESKELYGLQLQWPAGLACQVQRHCLDMEFMGTITQAIIDIVKLLWPSADLQLEGTLGSSNDLSLVHSEAAKDAFWSFSCTGLPVSGSHNFRTCCKFHYKPSSAHVSFAPELIFSGLLESHRPS